MKPFFNTKLVVATIVMATSFSIHAQSTSTTPDAPSVKDIPLSAPSPEAILVGTQKAYKAIRAELVKRAQDKNLTEDERNMYRKEFADLADGAMTISDDAARVSSFLGDNYQVLGILVTYGGEGIFGRNGHIMAAGVSGEFGVGVFFDTNAVPRLTGVFLGGGALEVSTDVNITQNRSMADRGWHIKFIVRNFLNKNAPKIINLRSLEGVYVGGGVDFSAALSVKAYFGGCLNKDEFLHDDLVRSGKLYSDSGSWRNVYQQPYNWFAEHGANCNAGIVSFAVSTNKNAPPVVVVGKGIYLDFPESNGGRGTTIPEAISKISKKVF